MSPTRPVAPYRLLFPIGLTSALIGAGLWPLWAIGAVPYLGIMHRIVMMQGFELSFVLGFLLTAMPGLTKGAPCRGSELAIAVASAVTLVASALLGATRVAEIATATSLLLLITAFARRSGHARVPGPAEMVFIGFGLLSGLVGALWQAVTGRFDVFPSRLFSLGLVLSLVLGVGGLLVPAFTGMRMPLAIPGISEPHERRRRLTFYLVVLLGLAGAFVLEARGLDLAGAALRAVAATTMVVWVWKLVRLPGRRDAPAWAMWSSGWLVVAGLWAAVIAPRFTLGALHVVFIGGFSLLTFGIGTRVVVAHGQHPLADEPRVLSWRVITLLAMALLARLAAEWMPARSALFLGASGVLWISAWADWAWRGLPRWMAPRSAGRPAEGVPVGPPGERPIRPTGSAPPPHGSAS